MPEVVKIENQLKLKESMSARHKKIQILKDGERGEVKAAFENA